MRSAAAATALGITLTIAGLAACTGPRPPGLSPGPEPSGTPVFASEEEALAAAEELYGEYLDVSNAIAQAGWLDVHDFETVERGDALSDDLETSAGYAEAGYRQVGSTTFDSLSLQQVEPLGTGGVSLVIYVCLDVTQADVVDSGGASVVSGSRPNRQALEVEMDDLDESLKVSRSETWSGQSFC